MSAERIWEQLHADPFVPFRMILSNGASYEIRDPELVVPMKREVFVAFSDGVRCTRVPLIRITTLEALSKGKRPPTNRR